MTSNSEPFRRTHATKRVMACDGRNKLLASVAGLCYILLYQPAYFPASSGAPPSEGRRSGGPTNPSQSAPAALSRLPPFVGRSHRENRPLLCPSASVPSSALPSLCSPRKPIGCRRAPPLPSRLRGTLFTFRTLVQYVKYTTAVGTSKQGSTLATLASSSIQHTSYSSY